MILPNFVCLVKVLITFIWLRLEYIYSSGNQYIPLRDGHFWVSSSITDNRNKNNKNYIFLILFLFKNIILMHKLQKSIYLSW